MHALFYSAVLLSIFRSWFKTDKDISFNKYPSPRDWPGTHWSWCHHGALPWSICSGAHKIWTGTRQLEQPTRSPLWPTDGAWVAPGTKNINIHLRCHLSYNTTFKYGGTVKNNFSKHAEQFQQEHEKCKKFKVYGDTWVDALIFDKKVNSYLELPPQLT